MFGRNGHERPSKTKKPMRCQRHFKHISLRVLLSCFFPPKLVPISLLVIIDAPCNIITIILQAKYLVRFPLFGSTSTRIISRHFSLLHPNWHPSFLRQFFNKKKLMRQASRTGFFYPLIIEDNFDQPGNQKFYGGLSIVIIGQFNPIFMKPPAQDYTGIFSTKGD